MKFYNLPVALECLTFQAKACIKKIEHSIEKTDLVSYTHACLNDEEFLTALFYATWEKI